MMRYFAILMACLLWASHLSAQYTTREPAFLGIYSEQISQEKARKLGFDNLYGSYVSRVVENSAAQRAGVQPFDYIYGIDEYRTGKEQTLAQIIRKYTADQDATLHFYRKGKNRTLNITFSTRSGQRTEASDKCQDPFFGISAAEMNEPETEGITVNIIDNSTAKTIGMEDGDHITAINDYRMLDWQDIKTAINTMKVGNQIAVDFIRNGKKMKKQGPIKSYCETKPDEAMQMEINVAPRPGDWFDRYFTKGEEPAIVFRSDNELQINIQSLGADEVARVNREKGLSLKGANNLAIEALSIEQDEDTVELKFTLPGNGETTVRIYNDTGRMIYQYDLGDFTGNFKDEANLFQNGAGNFFLEVQQGDRSVTKKITLSFK